MADGVLQYIGARYVPKFYLNSDGTPEWRSGVAFEPLTIVTYNNNSYTSRKPVPAEIGEPSVNPEYWAQTGVYNAQIGQLQNDVSALQADVEDLQEDVERMYWYTPEMYGAIGDGETDDTEAIQAMFDAAPDYSTIVFSKYRYHITSEIYVRKNFLRITGGFSNAEYGSIIYGTQTSGSFFVITGTGCELYGVMFVGVGRGTTLATAILLDHDNSSAAANSDCVVRNCTILAVEYGIRVLGRNLTVINTAFSGLRRGVTFEQTNISAELRGHWIHGCRFHGCAIAVLNNITNLLLKNLQVEGNVVDGGGSVLFLGYNGNVNIINNIVHIIPNTSGSGAVIVLNPNADTNTSDVYDVVEGNVMHIYGAQYTGINIAGGIKAIIKNNYIENTARRGINVEADCNVVVADNIVSKSTDYAFVCAATASGLLINNVAINTSNTYIAGGATSVNNN